MRHRLPTSLLLLLFGFGSGCVTQQPGTDGSSNAWNEPAEKANLRLYDARIRGDILVVYNEYSEQDDGVRTRAYFLNQNESRILQDRVPQFISANLSATFPEIPVISAMNNPKTPRTDQITGLFAVEASDEPTFTLYDKTRE